MTQRLSLPPELAFYITPPHPCSYLEGRDAITLFADPYAKLDQGIASQLAEVGFRRSGNHLYRPHCERCQACQSARIPVLQFRPDRSQRRCWKRNNDLEIIEKPQQVEQEHFELYKRYLSHRHPDSSMAVDDPEQYGNFLTSEWSDTRFVEFRDRGRLIGVAVIDWLKSGASAVYTFFEPDEGRRSLGTYAVLWQIESCKARGLPYVYLGYLIDESPQMNYKANYRPLEVFVDNAWYDYHALKSDKCEKL